MSPEQARSEPLTTASDWCSVGAVLYELLTGRLPYPRGHPGRAELIAASRRWMAGEGIRDPGRMVELVAPGFGPHRGPSPAPPQPVRILRAAGASSRRRGRSVPGRRRARGQAPRKCVRLVLAWPTPLRRGMGPWDRTIFSTST